RRSRRGVTPPRPSTRLPPAPPPASGRRVARSSSFHQLLEALHCVMIVDPRGAGRGSQGGRNVGVLAPFLRSQEEHLALKAGQLRKTLPNPALGLIRSQVGFGVG